MFGKIWRLLQPGARSSFLALAVLVSLGGLVELAGIATVAEFMGLIATGGAEPTTRGVIGRAMELGQAADSAGRLKFGLIVTVAVLGFVHAYSALKSYLRARFVAIQDRELSSELFSNILGKPYTWFLTRNSAELQRMLLGGSYVQRLLKGLLTCLGHLAVAGTLTLFLFYEDPWLALCGLFGVGVAYGLVRLMTFELLKVKGAEAHRADAEKRKTAQEVLTSIRFVKTTGREPFFDSRFSKHSGAASQGMVYHDIYVDLVRAFLEWVAFAGILTLSVYLLLQSENFEVLLPKLTLYTMACYRIIPAVHELFSWSTRLRFDGSFIDDLSAILDEPQDPTAQKAEGHLSLPEATPGQPLLSLDSVAYRYAEAPRPVLDGIDLEVRRGEWIGIVGTTGAGKTTLLDLISALCRPSAGTITVGSTQLTPEYVRDWQSRIGVVPQEVIMLDDTLARNVAFGLPDQEIDSQRLQQVCQASGLEKLIAGMPEGYQTRLGERGVRLSGGERQRVGLARALYLRPELLILDEATSALDQATEATIVETLKTLVDHCTMITVAHRLSSVRSCDRILVLSQGKIVGQGPYEELLQSSPEFRTLALASV